MNEERDAEALAHEWEQLDAASRQHVADEVIANAVTAAKTKPAELLRQYPRSTFEGAVQALEADARRNYDAELAAKYVVTDANTKALLGSIDDRIAKAESVQSEREVYGIGSTNSLTAALLEEHIVARWLDHELPRRTVTELVQIYGRLHDERDRTVIRLIESAVIENDTSRLGLKMDTGERDAAALLRLRADVTARRTARVPAALFELKDRVAKLRTRQRIDLMAHFAIGRGIASRPIAMVK